jgi:ankyrin repeat protein
MRIRYRLACCLIAVLCAASLSAAGSELADAVMRGNKTAVRSLLQRKVDVNAPQVDGTTALHWAVRSDDLETIDLLVRAGANVSARNRAGVMPLELAALNGGSDGEQRRLLLDLLALLSDLVYFLDVLGRGQPSGDLHDRK